MQVDWYETVSFSSNFILTSFKARLHKYGIMHIALKHIKPFAFAPFTLHFTGQFSHICTNNSLVTWNNCLFWVAYFQFMETRLHIGRAIAGYYSSVAAVTRICEQNKAAITAKRKDTLGLGVTLGN